MTSTIRADVVTSQTTNGDLSVSGNGSGVPNLEAGFKVGGSAGVPTASIQDDAVTLAKLAAGTDGELITWDASGDPAAVAVGTATHVLTSNGAGAAPTFQAAGGGGGFTSWQIFTSSGTWTKPSGITKIRVIVVGAGGGGSDDNNGAGGGAGGTAIKVVDVSSIASETVTIGAGGTDASNATAGGTTSFGSHCSSTGGGGGVSSYGYAGAGGVGSSGDFNAKGGRGNVAYGQSWGGGQGGTPALYGVHGGGCGYGQWLADTDAQYGGGGGGNGYGTSGLHGGDGLVIVEEYS